MTPALSLPAPPATHPGARHARPGGPPAARSPRGPIGAAVKLHGRLLAHGAAAVRR
ncbi:MAG: hypothetical protein JNM10_07585, partial [Planctomycetia bacterium]|nr:hypothetical protein [Planctomycetia bacterium]